MAEPFIGEIRLLSFDFAPQGWAPCDGRLLSIAQNQALYAVLGPTYGGDGQTTFALPDLRGRVPVHIGNGIQLGERAGEEMHALTVHEMPVHAHIVSGSSSSADKMEASGGTWAKGGAYTKVIPDVLMSQNALSRTGGGQAHNNMQPYSTARYCIALTGIFPTRD